MSFAKGSPLFCKEALSLKVLLACRAIEALAVIVVTQSLNPLVPRLNGKATPKAADGEHLVPIRTAVGKPVLDEEWVSVEHL